VIVQRFCPARVRVQLIGSLVIALSALVGIFATPVTVGQAAGICNSDPLTFNPADFIQNRKPIPITNTYFPLKPGAVYTYEGGGERVVVTVTRRRVEIDGVSALAVNEIVEDAATGERIETTTDYFAQDKVGNVWYFGEDTIENQTGSRAGTWRSGVDGSSAGIIMLANPQPGDSYLQEFAPDAALGPALDFATVQSKRATVTTPARTFTNTLNTRDGSCVEGGFQDKYYAPGVGLVLETKGNQRLELVSIR
jgi:hypothetical protein